MDDLCLLYYSLLFKFSATTIITFVINVQHIFKDKIMAKSRTLQVGGFSVRKLEFLAYSDIVSQRNFCVSFFNIQLYLIVC